MTAPSIRRAITPVAGGCSRLVVLVVGCGDKRVGCCEPVTVGCRQIIEPYNVLIAPASKVCDGFNGRLNATRDAGVAVEGMVVVH
jgi:hypothetical protein